MPQDPDNFATGEELRALMERYGLAGNTGAEIAATLIRKQPITIFSMLSRGLRRADLELLECKLQQRAQQRKGNKPPSLGKLNTKPIHKSRT